MGCAGGKGGQKDGQIRTLLLKRFVGPRDGWTREPKKKRKRERAGRRTEEVSEAVAYRYLYCIFMDRFWRTAITVSSQNAWRVIIMRQTSKLSLILNHIKHVCIYIYHIIIRLNLNDALI